MSAGSALVAAGLSAIATLVGGILIGLMLAPLATHYSLVLDTLSAPYRRPEIFALLRTANAIGVIFASALLTVASLSTALIAVTGLMLVATLAVGGASARQLLDGK